LSGRFSVLLWTLIAPLWLMGCYNRPTSPAQISGSYVSSLQYETVPCSRLAVELDLLARRERQLVEAQERRIESSNFQTLLIGHGKGDGLAASELARVRGEQAAVRQAMDVKRCGAD